ncbi:C-type lectin domain family 12 member A-like isoform X3 [Loxodonta africana]|uniref:C-type lectin domain family 12 member A-like isoform X3 n=1 Tax=Loxodonta africana TaxID=9785 RepID=UPI0030D14461
MYVLPQQPELFYIILKLKMGNLNELQSFKEELQRNISLQVMNNKNISKENMILSTTLQNIATELCRELYKTQKEHKCKPCPEKWLWHEDTCYGLSDDAETWQNSISRCSAWNASLLKITSESVLEFVKLQRFNDVWLGLSPGHKRYEYELLKEKINSSDWFTVNTDHLNDKYCGYKATTYVYYDDCTARKKFLCQKLADKVKIEMLNIPEERG